MQSIFEKGTISSFHKSNRTTIKHYINTESVNLINKVFNLNDIEQIRNIDIIETNIVMSLNDQEWKEEVIDRRIEIFP